MYICGLDISERAIHGSVIETGGGQTVRQFCTPRRLAALRAELEAVFGDVDAQPQNLRLVASDHGNDLNELLEPLWGTGYLRSITSPGSTADRLLLQAYHLQGAEWDRAHLLGYLARELHHHDDRLSRHQFCLQWAWLRTREKLYRLQHRRDRARRPDWLREPTRFTISRAGSPAPTDPFPLNCRGVGAGPHN